MDFLGKDKLARLDEERQRRRLQRADEAARRLEEVGKQTQQLVQERVTSDNPAARPGGLSRVLFETATGASQDPREKRQIRKLAGAVGIQREGARAIQHIDRAIGQIRGAVNDAAVNGFQNGLESAAQSVNSAVQRVTAMAQGQMPGAIKTAVATNPLADLMRDEHEETQTAAKQDETKEDAHEAAHEADHGGGFLAHFGAIKEQALGMANAPKQIADNVVGQALAVPRDVGQQLGNLANQPRELASGIVGNVVGQARDVANAPRELSNHLLGEANVLARAPQDLANNVVGQAKDLADQPRAIAENLRNAPAHVLDNVRAMGEHAAENSKHGFGGLLGAVDPKALVEQAKAAADPRAMIAEAKNAVDPRAMVAEAKNAVDPRAMVAQVKTAIDPRNAIEGVERAAAGFDPKRIAENAAAGLDPRNLGAQLGANLDPRAIAERTAGAFDPRAVAANVANRTAGAIDAIRTGVERLQAAPGLVAGAVGVALGDKASAGNAAAAGAPANATAGNTTARPGAATTPHAGAAASATAAHRADPHAPTSAHSPAHHSAAAGTQHHAPAAHAPAAHSAAAPRGHANPSGVAPPAHGPTPGPSTPIPSSTPTTERAASLQSANIAPSANRAQVDVASRAPVNVALQPVPSQPPRVDPTQNPITQPSTTINFRGDTPSVPDLANEAPQAPKPQGAPPAPAAPAAAQAQSTAQPRSVAPLAAAPTSPLSPENPALAAARGAAGAVQLPKGTVAPLPPSAAAPPAAGAVTANVPSAPGPGGVHAQAKAPAAPPAAQIPAPPAPAAAPSAPQTQSPAPPAPNVPQVAHVSSDNPPDPGSLVEQHVSLSADRSAAQSGISAEAQTQSRVAPEAQSQRASQVTPLGPQMQTTARSADAPMSSANASASAQGQAEAAGGRASEAQHVASSAAEVASQMAGASAERAQFAAMPPPPVLQQTSSAAMQPAATAVGAAVQAAAHAVQATPVQLSPAAVARGAAASATPSTLPPFDAGRFGQIDTIAKQPLPPVTTDAVDAAHAQAGQTYAQASQQVEQLANIPAPNIQAPASPALGQKTPGGYPTREAAIGQIEQDVVSQGRAQIPAQMKQAAAVKQGQMDTHIQTQQAAAQQQTAEQVSAAQAQAQEITQRPPPVTGAQAAAQAQPQYASHQVEATAAHEQMRGQIASAQASAEGQVQGARAQRDAQVATAQGQYQGQAQAQVAQYGAAHAAAQANFTAQNQAAQAAMAAEQQQAQADAQSQSTQAKAKADADLASHQASLQSQQAQAYASHQQAVQSADAQHQAQMAQAQAHMDSQVAQHQSQMHSQVAQQQAQGQAQVNQHLSQGEQQYSAEIAKGTAQANAKKAEAQQQAEAKKAQADAEKKKHSGGLFGSIIGWVEDRVNDLINLAKNILKAACDAICSIMEAARNAAVAALNAARQAALAALSTVKSAIQGIISAAAAAIRTVINLAASLIKGLIQTLAQALQQLVQELTTMLNTLISAFKIAVDALLSGLSTVLSMVDKVLGTHLADAVNKFKSKFDTAVTKLQSDIQAASNALQAGIQKAADAACSVVDAAQKTLDAAVTTIEHGLNDAVQAAYDLGAKAINAAFDAAEAVVNTAFDVAEGAVKAYFAMQIGALDLVQKGVHEVAQFAISVADKVMTAIDKVAQALVDMIPDSWCKAFVDFWNGPWRQVIIIGLATVAAVALVALTPFTGGLSAVAAAALIGGVLAGGAYFGGEMVAREGDIKLSSEGKGMYVPGFGYAQMGPDGKLIPPAGMDPNKLQEFEQQTQWAQSNFNTQYDANGKAIGYDRKAGDEITNYATQEGIKGFVEGAISSGLAVAGGGAGSWVADSLNMGAGTLMRSAVESTVANVITGPIQQSMTSAFDAGFAAIQQGKSPLDALKSAWGAGSQQLSNPGNWASAMIMMGIAPAKLKFLSPALDGALEGVESKAVNAVARKGSEIVVDTMGQTFGQAGGNFIGAYYEAIKSGKSPAEALAEARKAADSAFDPTSIATTLLMNTAGTISGPAHGGNEPTHGNRSEPELGREHGETGPATRGHEDGPPRTTELDQPARGTSATSSSERPPRTEAEMRTRATEVERTAVTQEHRIEEPPRLQDHIDRVAGVDKGPEYDRAMKDLKSFYENQEREARESLAEVKTTRTDQMVDAQGNPIVLPDGTPFGYGIESRFDARRFSYDGQNLTEVTMKVYLDRGAGVTDADIARVQHDAWSGVDHYYNSGKTLPNGDRLHVNVEFVNDPAQAHLKVQLDSGKGHANQSHWFVDSEATVHAHELGHQLGFYDEYHDPTAVNRRDPTSPGVHDDGSLMGNFWTRDANGNVIVDPNTEVKDRHLDQLHDDISAATATRDMRAWGPNKTEGPHVVPPEERTGTTAENAPKPPSSGELDEAAARTHQEAATNREGTPAGDVQPAHEGDPLPKQQGTDPFAGKPKPALTLQEREHALVSDRRVSTADAFTTVQLPKDPAAAKAVARDPANWTGERQAFHKETLERAVADAQKFADAYAAAGGDPTIVAMRGNTAAGKTRSIQGDNVSPALRDAVAATKNDRHRGINPDNFKIEIYEHDAALHPTAGQAHLESSVLAEQFQKRVLDLKTSDGKTGSVLVDKRLGEVSDVTKLQQAARDSGRAFELVDVDAPLHNSLAGVLGDRVPGGNDPIPPFEAIAKGFDEARNNRLQTIAEVTKDPNSSYKLFATTPDGRKVLVAEVKPLEGKPMPADPSSRLIVHDEEAFKKIADPEKGSVAAEIERIRNSPIDDKSIHELTDPLGDYGKKLAAKLEQFKGKTWGEAVDHWSKTTAEDLERAKQTPPAAQAPDDPVKAIDPRDPNRFAKFIDGADQLHKPISEQQRYDVVKDFPVKMITSAPGHQNLRSPEAMVSMANEMNKRGTGNIFDGKEKIQLNVFTEERGGHVVVRSIEVQDGNHRLAAGLHSGKWQSIKDIPPGYLDIQVNGFDTQGTQHARWIPLAVAKESSIPGWKEVPEGFMGAKGGTAEVSGGVSSQDATIPEKFRGVTLDKVIDRSLERVGSHDNKPHAPEPRAPEAEVAQQRAHIDNDVVNERIAHGIAYKDTLSAEDHAYLEQHGLTVGGVIKGVGGLDMTTFVPLHGSNAQPVLAFRGTHGVADMIDDVHPAGVGAYQMAANEGLIAKTLASLEAYGKPVVVGHSLGGALAQMTAVRFPERVGSVVTFQSPGIPRDMVTKLDNFNKQAEANGQHGIETRHYQASDDIIPLAGEAFTSGFRTVFEAATKVHGPAGLLAGHVSHPVGAFAEKGGRENVRIAHVDEPTRTEPFHHYMEALRVGTGRAIEMLERFGHLGRAPREDYVRTWNEVRAGMERGEKPAHLAAIIDRSNLFAKAKAMMLANLRSIALAEMGETPPGGAKPAARKPDSQVTWQSALDQIASQDLPGARAAQADIAELKQRRQELAEGTGRYAALPSDQRAARVRQLDTEIERRARLAVEALKHSDLDAAAPEPAPQGAEDPKKLAAERAAADKEPAAGTLGALLKTNGGSIDAIKDQPWQLQNTAALLLAGKGIHAPTQSQLDKTVFELDQAIKSGKWQDFTPSASGEIIHAEDGVNQRLGNIFGEKKVFTPAQLTPEALKMSPQQQQLMDSQGFQSGASGMVMAASFINTPRRSEGDFSHAYGRDAWQGFLKAQSYLDSIPKGQLLQQLNVDTILEVNKLSFAPDLGMKAKFLRMAAVIGRGGEVDRGGSLRTGNQFARPEHYSPDEIANLNEAGVRTKDMPGGTMLQYPKPDEVRPGLEKIIAELKESLAQPNADPVMAASQFQRHFVALHPFGDSNGRTSRLLMNRILAEFDMPPAILADSSRDVSKSPQEWREEVAKGVARSKQFLETYPVARRDDYRASIGTTGFPIDGSKHITIAGLPFAFGHDGMLYDPTGRPYVLEGKELVPLAQMEHYVLMRRMGQAVAASKDPAAAQAQDQKNDTVINATRALYFQTLSDPAFAKDIVVGDDTRARKADAGYKLAPDPRVGKVLADATDISNLDPQKLFAIGGATGMGTRASAVMSKYAQVDLELWYTEHGLKDAGQKDQSALVRQHRQQLFEMAKAELGKTKDQTRVSEENPQGFVKRYEKMMFDTSPLRFGSLDEAIKKMGDDKMTVWRGDYGFARAIGMAPNNDIRQPDAKAIAREREGKGQVTNMYEDLVKLEGNAVGRQYICTTSDLSLLMGYFANTNKAQTVNLDSLPKLVREHLLSWLDTSAMTPEQRAEARKTADARHGSFVPTDAGGKEIRDIFGVPGTVLTIRVIDKATGQIEVTANRKAFQVIMEKDGLLPGVVALGQGGFEAEQEIHGLETVRPWDIKSTHDAGELGQEFPVVGQPPAPAAPIQRKAAGPAPDGADLGAIAAQGTKGAGGALPHADKIQASFGTHDVGGVKAHVGGEAARAAKGVGAEAFAHGDHVAFAGSPDLHTAAHEAAHVVQQRGGVQLKGGIDGGASDPYEQHADAVADKVVRGESAQQLLDQHAGGGGSPAVQRDGGKEGDKNKADDLKLPDKVNFQIMSDGTIVARKSWLDSDPDRKESDEGVLVPQRMVAMLSDLKSSGILSWIDAAEIPVLSQKVGIVGTAKDGDFTQLAIAFNVYLFIGPPPWADVIFNRNGKGLDGIVRQSTVIPGPVTKHDKVVFSETVREKIFSQLEVYTGMPIDPAKRNILVHGPMEWKNDVDPELKGVLFWMSEAFFHKVYGQKKWDEFIAKPQKSGGGAIGGGGIDFAQSVPEADRKYFLEWMKQLKGGGDGKATPYTITPEFIAELRKIDANPLKDKILEKLSSGKGGSGTTLDLQLLRNAENAVETEHMRQELGLETPKKSYKPIYDQPIDGTIVNRGGLNYVGQDTEFYFESAHVKDTFAIPDLVVQWVITKKGDTKKLKVDTTHSIDIHTEKPDYFSFEWPETGIYTIHAFVSHAFYQSRYFEIDVEVKTEQQRTKEINDPAFKGLEGQAVNQDEDHPFDVSKFNTTFGSHKEEYGKITYGKTPDDFKHMSYEDRVKFLATDKKNLDDMIAAHKGSNDPQWQDTIKYAQDQLKALQELQGTLDKENSDGATFFEARGTFLSRQNGVPDSTLKLLASAKKDGADVNTTVHDLTQLTEPQNSTFTGSGSTWDKSIEETFVKLAKSYPEGRISCMFEAVDQDLKPNKQTRKFEFDTGTAWKDVKHVVWNPKVQMAVNIAGAVTMIFFPPSAAVLFPVLATYNSIDTIDHMAELRERGNLGWQDVASGVGQIGLNFLPYVGELKPIAQLGKVGVYALDGVMIAGQTVIMTADAVHQLEQLRDRDVQAVADLDAKIREKERTNPSDPELPKLRQDLQDAIKHAQDESTEVMKGMAANLSIMLVQTAGLKALQAHVATKSLGQLKGEGIFHEQKGVELHYDDKSGTIKGDSSKADPAKVEQLKQAYAADMSAKREALAKELGVDSDKVEIKREGTKVKVTKDGDGFKVTIPVDHPFSSAIDEAKRFVKATATKPAGGSTTPAAPTDGTLSGPQRALITNKVAATAGDHIGDTVDKSFLTEQQSDAERWQTHGLEDTAAATDSKNPKEADRAKKVAGWLSDPEFRHWYDVWMSMPDRVVIDPSGKPRANLPHGVPAEMGERMKAIAELGNIGLMTRAANVSARIEKEFPGLNPDPQSTAWQQARPKLVEMLGEEQVATYERERGGTQDAATREAHTDRLHELVDSRELDRVTALCPGSQVYVTGSAAQLSKDIGGVTDLDLIVVVPKNTPQRARAELEDHLRGMKLASATKGGAPLPIDAKVMTEEQFMGLSMLETPKNADGTSRTPMDNFRIDAPTGAEIPGTGSSGGDLHNHVMGVPRTQYFIDKVGGGNAVKTLDLLAKDVKDPALWAKANSKNPPVQPGVMQQIQTGLAEVHQAQALGMPPAVVEARARNALDAILSTQPQGTPFDHTYDIRDLFVQKHIDPNGRFENFAKDVITDLHDQGVTYSEQSVSAGKLEKRFTPEALQKAHERAKAEGKDSEMDFLVMVPTHETLSAGSMPDTSKQDASLKKVLMRPDVKGIDVAAPEKVRFTESGMQWLVDRYKLLDNVAKTKGEKMVLRPHVGEGYDPAGTGDHVEIARDNLRQLVKTLKDLGYTGSGDVIVRLGHATHADAATLQDMASIGVIVESNVGSNLATGSILSADDHPLLLNMYFGVKTVLSTDAQGVMGTTLPVEYQRAGFLIDKFKAGEPLVIDGKNIYYKDLDATQRQRFSIEWLQEQLADYRKSAGEPVASPSTSDQ